LAEDPADKSEVVHYREEQRILTIVDRVAKSKGSDRSTIIRESIRFWLGYNSHLTDQEKKDLGVNGQTK
jgi:metal-responsive CopG/Arc/MetJ family transcriptional regulator